MGRSVELKSEKKEEFIVQEKAGKEIRRFKKIKLIGRGGFAEVFMCVDSKTNQEVAVKVMSREKLSKINGAREKLMTEVSIHRGLSHPHVVRFEEFFEDYYHFYIVLELCLGENLETLLKNERRFDEPTTRHYMRQLIEALMYLRDNKVIHRDLKLANLFADSTGTVKLGDFGLACKHDNANRKRKSVCGTPNYIAPEMLGGEGHSFQVDTWAVGILLFAMLIGKPPFETSNMKMTYNRIQSCMYVFPPDREISTAAKVLIQKILAKNPAKRPSFEEILDSDFFKDGVSNSMSLKVPAVSEASNNKSSSIDKKDRGLNDEEESNPSNTIQAKARIIADSDSGQIKPDPSHKRLLGFENKESKVLAEQVNESEKPKQATKEEPKSTKVASWGLGTNTVKPSWSKGSLFAGTVKPTSQPDQSTNQISSQSNPVKDDASNLKPAPQSPSAKEPAILKKIMTTLEVKPSAHVVDPPSARGADGLRKHTGVGQSNPQPTSYVWGSKAATTNKAPLWGSSTTQTTKSTVTSAANSSPTAATAPAKPAAKEANPKLLFLSQVEKTVTPPPEPKKVEETSTATTVWGSKPAKTWYAANQGSPQKPDPKPVQSVLTSSVLFTEENKQGTEKKEPSTSVRPGVSPPPKFKESAREDPPPAAQRMASKGKQEEEIRPRKLSAFEILKNATKLQSLTTSMIGHDGEELGDEKSESSPTREVAVNPKAPIWAKGATDSQSRRDLRLQTSGNDSEQNQRDSSIQKRMFFQRMLTMEKNVGEGEGEESPKKTSSPQKASMDSNLSKVRAGSIKPTNKETESRVLKDFLGEDSPSTATPQPGEESRSRAQAAASRVQEERSNSVQGMLKIKPFWHKEEEVKPPESFEPSDYICHWIDHSSKYGLVFIMQSAIVGFLFNDQTKILVKLGGEKFVYLAKNATKHREEVKIYNINFPPKELEKKMAILSEVLPTVKEVMSTLGLKADDTPVDKIKERVYVKNWVKAKQVIVFKLSNTVYQAVFQDKSEVLMSSKAESILFIDKDRKKENFALTSPDIQNNRSVSARIEYFKKVLRKWVERDSNTTHLSRANNELDV